MYIPFDSTLMPHLLTSWSPLAYLHCRTNIRIPTPKSMATLYSTETVPIAQTLIWIPIQIQIPSPPPIVAVPTLGMDVCQCLAM